MRVGAPFCTTDFREITKNAKLGELQLKRGENLLIALNLNHFKESEFQEALKFDRNRFLDSSKRYSR